MLRFVTVACVAILSGLPVLAQAPCFETNLGTLIPLFDDEVSLPQALGFTFPGSAGPVTTIGISSNGFIWLDGTSTDSRCCFGNEQQFLSDPPSIAVGWMDLYPPGAGTGDGVFFNAIGGASPSAVITWLNVPEFFSEPPVTYQLQLFPSGEFIITHGGTSGLSTHDLLVGVTSGNNATANPIDFAGLWSAPANSGTNPTAYEVFTSFPNNYDVAGKSFHFIPNAQGGYLVIERTQCRQAGVRTFGLGCPDPNSIVVYEEFLTGTYDLANTTIAFVPSADAYFVFPSAGAFLDPLRAGSAAVDLQLTDDSVSSPLVLPFPFNFPGGGTSSIEVSSNGLVYLQAGVMGGNSWCCSGDPLSFPGFASATFAAFWQDLNPSAGGAVFAEADPATSSYVITWNQVPEFGSGSNINTIQLALHGNGLVELRTLAANNVFHTALVGFSGGNSVNPPPPATDFTVAMPFFTSAGVARLALAPSGTSMPQLGTTFLMDVTGVPSSAALGFMVLSFGDIPGGFDLTPIGMTGCNQYVSLTGAATFVFAATPPAAQFSLAIPNNTAFVGIVLHAQGAAAPSTSTPLGVVVTNGLTMLLGV